MKLSWHKIAKESSQSIGHIITGLKTKVLRFAVSLSLGMMAKANCLERL
jgi:hypothetical protein